MEDVENEEKEAEAAIKHLRANGRHSDADSLEAKLREHRAQLDEYKKSAAEEASRRDPRHIDFANPTSEQIEDARKHGIDLFDPVVVRELQRMQREGDSHEWSEEEGEGGTGGEGGGRAESGIRYRGRGGDKVSGESLDSPEHAAGGLAPRTRYTIMAIAVLVGLLRIWAVLSPSSSRLTD